MRNIFTNDKKEEVKPLRRNLVKNGRGTYTGHEPFYRYKMGILGCMGGLANDVADNGIPGDMVLPGPTNILAIVASIGGAKTRHLRTAGHQGLGQPEDITGAILFVTSDDAAFITRQAIVVDGGQYSIG